MLCRACDEFRFPTVSATAVSTSAAIGGAAVGSGSTVTSNVSTIVTTEDGEPAGPKSLIVSEVLFFVTSVYDLSLIHI